MYVYLITNKVNGKVYVGQHKGNNLKQYLQQKCHEAGHRLSLRSYLYAAIRKYGRDAFSIEPLAKIYGDMPKTVLDNLETFCIAFLDSRNPEIGYNICRGGEGFTGPHSEETKRKIGQQSKNAWKRSTYRESVVSKMWGRTNIWLSNFNLNRKGKPGRIWLEESKRKNTVAHQGKPKSVEATAKSLRSKQAQGAYFSPQTCQKYGLPLVLPKCTICDEAFVPTCSGVKTCGRRCLSEAGRRNAAKRWKNSS